MQARREAVGDRRCGHGAITTLVSVLVLLHLSNSEAPSYVRYSPRTRMTWVTYQHMGSSERPEDFIRPRLTDATGLYVPQAPPRVFVGYKEHSQHECDVVYEYLADGHVICDLHAVQVRLVQHGACSLMTWVLTP